MDRRFYTCIGTGAQHNIFGSNIIEFGDFTLKSGLKSPYFFNLGDITIDEDQTYEGAWAFNISAGADNEEQDLFFIVTFDDDSFIEEYSLIYNDETLEGLFIIVPTNNVYTEEATNFSVRIVDDQFSQSDLMLYQNTLYRYFHFLF